MAAGLVSGARAASSVTLAWDACTEPGIAGHRVYWGAGSRNYTNLVSVGAVTSAIISGLETGVTYYFAVTALDTIGLESDYSSEVSYTAASSAAPTVVLTSPAAGASYTAPAAITVAASVTPNGRTINKVQFYNGSTLLGEDAVAPYSYAANLGAGTCSLSAKAVYDSTNSVASAVVSVTVTNAPATNAPSLPAPWQTVDVGAPGVTGSASVASGVYTVAGAGSFTGNSDQFRFAYQPMTGKGEIRARIRSQQNTGTSALAGIMVRETLTPGSRYAFVGLAPTGNVSSRSRSQTSSATSAGATAATAVPPDVWVRLVRSGSAFNSYTSTDGVSWKSAGSVKIPMGTSVYFGLAVGSGSSTVLNSSTFDSLTLIP